VAKRVSYIPFLALAAEWAAESGMPSEFALRNVCEWTIAGAFPPDSLRTPTGASVAPFDVYLSSLALIQSGELSHNSSIKLGRFTLVNGEQRWGLRCLSEILVNVTDILAFCERTNTLPPPSVSRGAKRIWVRWARTPHLAPPPFPDAENIAIRFHEHELAVGTMNRMRSCLNKLQGTQSPPRNMRQPSEPIDLKYYQAQWDTDREFAKASIENSGDTALLQPLRELEDDWAAFIAQEQLLGAPEPPAEEPSRVDPGDEEAPGPAERTSRRGRPPGSGSFESADAPLIEEMHAAILRDPTLSVSAAAALVVDRAKGGGTPQSKVRRLIERYSEKFGAAG
jgi:hypothetical protein